MSEKPESELDKFTATSIRGPKRGIYEQLLCGLLLKASNTNDPLIKISAICEAAYMSRKKDKLDMNLIEVASLVCTSFMNTETTKKTDAVKITWAFSTTEENWKRFIEPWQKISKSFYPFETDLRNKLYPLQFRYDRYNYDDANKFAEWREEVNKNISEKIHEMELYKAFFEITTALAKNSFLALQGEFSRWALPKLLEVQAAIAEEVDPEVYAQVFAATKEESESEGSMGPRR